MEKKKLVFTGTAGYSEGAVFEIKEGESKVIGRSRSCDFSLRKLKAWMEASEEERESAEEFKTVSRRHAKIEVVKEGDDIKAQITDLSRNGTYVDEEKIGPGFTVSDWNEAHYCRFGELEQFKIELAEDAGEGEEPATSQTGREEAGDGVPTDETKEGETGKSPKVDTPQAEEENTEEQD
jgi:pSer/pThr/pTyr-binding forkhead associated (FHA) protein